MSRKITITEKIRDVMSELRKQADLLSLEPKGDLVDDIVGEILDTMEKLITILTSLDLVYKALDNINEEIRTYMAVKELEDDG